MGVQNKAIYLLPGALITLVMSVAFSAPLVFAQEELPELEAIPIDIQDPGLAQPASEEFYRGEVLEILEEKQEDFGLSGTRPISQKVSVLLEDGPRQGEVVVIDYGSLVEGQKMSVGQRVVVVDPGSVQTFIFDKYRLPELAIVAAIFVALAVITAGWRGLTSLLGLVASVLVLVFFVVPRIMGGGNPLLISLLAAFVIAIVSIYLAHGFSRRTTVAVISTLITTSIAAGLAQAFVSWAGLLGIGSEEAFNLQTSSASFINLRGILLGGIIIGALGVLDDITTSQAAAVDEIRKADPSLSRQELYRRGASVGREHITSLVNTLALAYVGASFPALLLFTVYQRPWWVVANSEAIAEEIIRTLVGSMALMLAVPITTLLAVYWLPGKSEDVPSDPGHSHAH